MIPDGLDETPPGVSLDLPIGSTCRYCGRSLVDRSCGRCAPLLRDVKSLADYRRFVADARLDREDNR